MAATFDWEEDNGAASGSPPKGTTRTTGRTDVNWKNVDDSTTANTGAPISAGNNSFEKWQFGKFSGTFTTILAGLYAHITTSFGTGLTLKGTVGTTYTTPSTTTNTNLTTDMTTPISIGSGLAVEFGATGPEASGKATSTTSNPGYTQYLTTQLQTTPGAAGGLTAQVTMELQYQEN